MSSFIKDRVIYNGIDEYIFDDISSFSYLTIDSIINLPISQPNIEELVKVSIDSHIIDGKIVKTATGTSLEGQVLTGYKYLSEGKFIARFDYCSNDIHGCIYTYKSEIFFNSSVALDEGMDISSRIITNIYVEDIYAEVISKNEILINITFVFIIEDF